LVYNQPFPLYPGESFGKSEKLITVPRDSAIKLEALRDFDDVEKRVAGDEWLEEGPKIYIPRVEVKVREIVKPTIIKSNEALKVKATKVCKDYKDVERKAGEEWLIRDPGFYLPKINESVCGIVTA
jgi:major vault protein